MGKEVIATDIDEVLFPFVQEFKSWHNQEYGTRLSVDDFVSYEFSGVLDVSVQEAIHRVHTFLNAEHSHVAVSPLEEAQEAITKMGEQYNIVAITARHPMFEAQTTQYLLHHFGDIITDVTLLGHPETTAGILRTKAEACRELGAVALVDDSIMHVTDCAGAGIQGVLFGDYPWNQTDELPNGVVRYKNWGGVLEHFGVSK